MTQLTNVALSNNLIAKTLNDRNPFEAVYDISGGFNTLTQITSMINGGKSKEVSTEKYEKSKRGNLNIAANISANSLSGSDLVVDLVDASFNLFRVGDVVMDTERIQGRVKSKTAGQITLEPVTVTSFDTALHFTAGQRVKRIFDASKNRFSGGKTSIYNTPDLDFNFSSITRNSVQLARRDMLDTRVKTRDGFWWTNQEVEMVKDLARQVEHKFIFSERNQLTFSGEEVNFNGGLIWAIKNRGGTIVPSSSELDQDQFQDLIRQVITKEATRGKNLVMLHGTAALFNIQQFTASSFLQFTGMDNTFGGKTVKGLDIQHYAIGATTIDFMHLPILDDPELFPEISSITGKPRFSSAFFLLDLTPIPSVGEMGPLPAIERFHFGKNELSYTYVPGMVGPDGGDPTSVISMDRTLSVSDLDGFSAHVLTDNGIDILDAKNMLFFELTS